jgi:hypothetical protein
MQRVCGRLCASLLGASLVAGVAVAAGFSASGTPLSPKAGDSVQAAVKTGFSNGPITLRWSAEFSDCPGGDNLHTSFPELRKKGDSWAQQELKYGPGSFSAQAYVYPDQTKPVQYEWRVHWQCGGYGTDFLGSEGFSQVVSFLVLPLTPQVQCVVPNVTGKTAAAAGAALSRAHCRLGAARQAYSTTVKKGRVISQALAPGARGADRTAVAVVVSRGPRK